MATYIHNSPSQPIGQPIVDRGVGQAVAALQHIADVNRYNEEKAHERQRQQMLDEMAAEQLAYERGQDMWDNALEREKMSYEMERNERRDAVDSKQTDALIDMYGSQAEATRGNQRMRQREFRQERRQTKAEAQASVGQLSAAQSSYRQSLGSVNQELTHWANEASKIRSKMNRHLASGGAESDATFSDLARNLETADRNFMTYRSQADRLADDFNRQYPGLGIINFIDPKTGEVLPKFNSYAPDPRTGENMIGRPSPQPQVNLPRQPSSQAPIANPQQISNLPQAVPAPQRQPQAQPQFVLPQALRVQPQPAPPPPPPRQPTQQEVHDAFILEAIRRASQSPPPGAMGPTNFPPSRTNLPPGPPVQLPQVRPIDPSMYQLPMDNQWHTIMPGPYRYP